MNYVLIYPDEMRAESLRCYGHPLVETPNIDALAAEGTLFAKNYTQHPVCTASRVALVTGLYPHVNGFRSLKHYLDKNDPNFISEMVDAGFNTYFCGKSDCFNYDATRMVFTEVDPMQDRRFYDIEGIGQLYRKMQENPPATIVPKKYNMINPPIHDSDEDKKIDFKITSWACDKIKEHAKDEKPFFMMVSLMNPHPSYEALERYYNKYDPDKLPPLRDLSWLEGKPELYRLIHKYRELGENDESIGRKMNAIYLGMISYVDELTGRIVNAIKEAGIYDDTMIILCSDHGDFAGDAGMPEKWPSAMDDMLTRVPLIIRRPGCSGGNVVDTPTQSIDIFPTIFDFENIKIERTQYGVSLAPQVMGAPGDASRIVYCDGGYDTNEMHCFEGTPLFTMHMIQGGQYYPKMMQQQKDPQSVCRVIMQRDNRYKLNIRTNGENELYDMDKDPLEYKNLYNDPEYKELRDQLTLKMLTWLIHSSDITPLEGHVLPKD